MFVKVAASVGGPLPRLLVEERAIGTDQRGDYLLVVNDKNVVEYRSVRTGIHFGALRVIEDGVTKNDWVVVNGLQRARPGATVNPERAKMTAPPTIKVEQSGGIRLGAARPPVEDKPATKPNTDTNSEGDTKKKADSPPTEERPREEQKAAPTFPDPCGYGRGI